MNTDTIRRFKASLNFTNLCRALSLISLPLAIVQSAVFAIYASRTYKYQPLYYHGLTIEGIVQACLIYGTFFKKHRYLVPYILLQILIASFYMGLSLLFFLYILGDCHLKRFCYTKQLEQVWFDNAEPIQLAAISCPLQCTVAAVITKFYYRIKESGESK